MKKLVLMILIVVSPLVFAKEHKAVCEYANHNENVLRSFPCKVEYGSTNVSVVSDKPMILFKRSFTWVVFNGTTNGWQMMATTPSGTVRDLQLFSEVNVIHNEHGKTTEIFFAEQQTDGNVVSFGMNLID